MFFGINSKILILLLALSSLFAPVTSLFILAARERELVPLEWKAGFGEA
jgi:hypothetical protein